VQTTIVTLFGVATLLLTLVRTVCTPVAHSVVVAHASSRSARRRCASVRCRARAGPATRLIVVLGGVVAGFGRRCPLSTTALRSLVVEAPSFDLRLAAGVACLLVAGALVSRLLPGASSGRVDTAQLLKAE